jgi:hypothetical protein
MAPCVLVEESSILDTNGDRQYRQAQRVCDGSFVRAVVGGQPGLAFIDGDLPERYTYEYGANTARGYVEDGFWGPTLTDSKPSAAFGRQENRRLIAKLLDLSDYIILDLDPYRIALQPYISRRTDEDSAIQIHEHSILLSSKR